MTSLLEIEQDCSESTKQAPCNISILRHVYGNGIRKRNVDKLPHAKNQVKQPETDRQYTTKRNPLLANYHQREPNGEIRGISLLDYGKNNE